MTKSYDIPGVLRLKHKIETDMQVCEYVGTAPEGADFEHLVGVIHKLMPDRIRRDTILRSIENLAGQELTPEILSDTAWRLAGNVSRIRAGRVTMPWTHQPQDEWVPAQIISTNLHKNYFGEIGSRVAFRILAGTSCPLIATEFWRRKFCRHVARKIGFTSLRGKYPMRHDSELVSLRLKILISAEKSLGKPIITEIAPYSAGTEWNRQLLRWRTRAPGCGFDCMKNYRTLPCFKCEVGYQECAAAVHKQTYELAVCPRCKEESFFDPAKPKVKICVNCYNYKIVSDEEHNAHRGSS